MKLNHSSGGGAMNCGEGPRRRAVKAFTLLEVMIAIGIFFIGSCAILDLISSSLNNVRHLQRPSVDASPVLARYAATNRLVEGIYTGNLGEPELLGKDYRDYSYLVEVAEIDTNHLFRVTCAVTTASGHHELVSQLSTVFYKPQSPPGSLDGGPGMRGR